MRCFIYVFSDEFCLHVVNCATDERLFGKLVSFSSDVIASRDAEECVCKDVHKCFT